MFIFRSLHSNDVTPRHKCRENTTVCLEGLHHTYFIFTRYFKDIRRSLVVKRENLAFPVRVVVNSVQRRFHIKPLEQKHLSETSFSSAKSEVHLSEPGSSLLCSALLSYIQRALATALSLIANWRLLMLPTRTARAGKKMTDMIWWLAGLLCS